MLDFDVHARGRKCAKSDRAFEPGETYFSVLMPEGSNVVRYDYAADAWEGPPETSLGWWQSTVPDHRGGKVHWAPNDVMLQYFEELEDNVEKHDVRYVLALLMVRRRILRWDEAAPGDAGEELLTLFCPKSENTYQVRVVQPTAEQITAIQDELAELLFGGA